MQLLENPWIFNIPLIDTPDDIDECEECGRSESLFYVVEPIDWYWEKKLN